MPSCYEVLGVSPKSEQEVIEGAYRALIRKYHPDRAGDNDRIRDINAAYDILRDPARRKVYDEKLNSAVRRELVKHVEREGSGTSSSSGTRATQRCPECAEMIAADAKVCRYCGHRLQPAQKTSLGVPALAKVGCLAAPVVAVLLLASGVISLKGGAPEFNNAADAPSPLDLLRTGSPEVCSRDEVQITAVRVFANQVPALKSAFDKLSDDWEQGKASNPVGFEAVSLVGRDQAILEVSCRANAVLGKERFPINYVVRPMSGPDAGFVVEAVSERQEELLTGLKGELQRLGRLDGTGSARRGSPPLQQKAPNRQMRMEYPEGLTPAGKALYDELNTKCRGGSGNDPATLDYCAQRDAMWEVDV